MSSLSLADLEKDDIEFSVKPNKCVALHQGQTCYQELHFSWRIYLQGEFCLHITSQAEPLVCWESDERTSFEYDFQSHQGADFIIVEKNTSSSLAAVNVNTAWVYKSKKRKTGSWRLF